MHVCLSVYVCFYRETNQTGNYKKNQRQIWLTISEILLLELEMCIWNQINIWGYVSSVKFYPFWEIWDCLTSLRLFMISFKKKLLLIINKVSISALFYSQWPNRTTLIKRLLKLFLLNFISKRFFILKQKNTFINLRL